MSQPRERKGDLGEGGESRFRCARPARERAVGCFYGTCYTADAGHGKGHAPGFTESADRNESGCELNEQQTGRLQQHTRALYRPRRFFSGGSSVGESRLPARRTSRAAFTKARSA